MVAMPSKRWSQSDSIIKEAPNHSRYQLDDDNGRSMQLEQVRLSSIMRIDEYIMIASKQLSNVKSNR